MAQAVQCSLSTELTPLTVMNQTYTEGDDGKPIAIFFCRDLLGTQHRINVTNFRPHFFAKLQEAVETRREIDKAIVQIKDTVLEFTDPKQLNKAREALENIDLDNTNFKTIHENDVVKVTTRLPQHVPKVKKGLASYQADVDYTINLLINLGCKFAFYDTGFNTVDFNKLIPADNYFEETNTRIPLPRVCSLDLEIDTGGTDGFKFTIEESKQGLATCISIALFDSYDKDMTVIYWTLPQSKKIPEWDSLKHLLRLSKTDKNIAKFLNLSINSKNNSMDILMNIKLIKASDEKGFFNELFNWLERKKPDIIIGWNNKWYDIPVLVSRAKRLRVDWRRFSPTGYVRKETPDKKEKERFTYRLGGVAVWDMYDLYKAYTIPGEGAKESWKLDFIGHIEVGAGKFGRYGAKTGYLWRHDVTKLIKYVAVDALLPHLIATHRGLITYYYENRNTTGAKLSDIHSSMRLIDTYILHRAREKSLVLRTKRSSEKKRKGKGAIVFFPVPGVHFNVIGLDLKSLYPSIMRSCNMSPETLIGTLEDIVDEDTSKYIITPNGTVFSKGKEGFVAEIVGEFIEKRDEMKRKMKAAYKAGDEETGDYYDSKQKAFKGLTNAVYGIMMNEHYRFYSLRMGEAVTTTGQTTIKAAKNKIVEFVHPDGYRFRVIYGDTDSIFVQVLDAEGNPYEKVLDTDLLVELGLWAASELDKMFDELAKEWGCDTHYLSIKAEKICARIFLSDGKKTYAYHLVWEEGLDKDEFKVMGFGAKRSDNSKLSRKLQKAVLKMLTFGATEREVHLYIKKYVKLYEAFGGKMSWFDLLEIIGIPQGIKHFDPSRNHPSIRASVWSNRILNTQIGSGDKPKILYVHKHKLPHSIPPIDVIAYTNPLQVPESFRAAIDIPTMIDKTIIAKVKKIMGLVGMSHSDITAKRRLRGLGRRK